MQGFSIEPLTEHHFESALAMCRAAGWNQLRSDWQRLLDYEPEGCFVAIGAGEVVGTVTTTCYGRSLAWIGMMLVHPDLRRRGIATELMRTSIEYLRQERVRCIQLDATPTGEHVYRKLGFLSEWSFRRWHRAGEAHADEKPCLDGEPCSVAVSTWCGLPDGLPGDLLQLDENAFGADRSSFLKRLADDSWTCHRAEGFGMLRRGFLADYLGPITAKTADAGRQLIEQLCAGTQRSVFWDIPAGNQSAVDIAQSLGFAPVRALTRMRLGDFKISPDLSQQFAISDPGTG